MDFIKTYIERSMMKHLESPQNSCILVGDLNSCYHKDGVQQSCKAWADNCGLVNSIADAVLDGNLIFKTRFRSETGTGFIDHIMHARNNISLLRFGSSNSVQWNNNHIDHRPV